MWGSMKDWMAVSFKSLRDRPEPYFSTPAEALIEIPFVLLPIPPETEEVKPNLDAMTPAELTKFIEEQEKTHKESQRALRALLRAKIVLAPKPEAAILA